ncbi:hypothetical protein L2E82_39053 [Cichorium intybus]|uniref:Uncharacterized protein n=1 Tax=Cichorium intybus TaxID=13427 RepID=A0ACB9AIU9_CICIN|nr:hypothetical protein L2E82_39053 [Cichorium intybus]
MRSTRELRDNEALMYTHHVSWFPAIERTLEGNALMRMSDLNVHLPLEKELCPFDLVRTTSTMIQMVFWCTMAITMMDAKNLTKEGCAANHPAGRIGKSLIFIRSLMNLYVHLLNRFYVAGKNVMKKQEELPVCREGDLMMDQLVELTSKGCDCLLVIDDGYHLIGTFTDGDLRRTLKASKEGIFKLILYLYSLGANDP